jgi:hypothetical protein
MLNTNFRQVLWLVKLLVADVPASRNFSFDMDYFPLHLHSCVWQSLENYCHFTEHCSNVLAMQSMLLHWLSIAIISGEVIA